MLERILVGNIISMSKGLRYTVPGQIEANIFDLREIHTKLKGTPMLGFKSTFSVNFEIPDYWGIGKSMSRGLGRWRKAEVDWGMACGWIKDRLKLSMTLWPGFYETKHRLSGYILGLKCGYQLKRCFFLICAQQTHTGAQIG